MSVVEKVESAVLVLAPRGKDAEHAAAALSAAAIETVVCPNLVELAQDVDDLTNAIIIAEEALVPSDLLILLDVLGQQPPWSDLPLIILTAPGGGDHASVQALEIFGPAANVTLLERPLRAITLVAAAKFALRARRRQREVRDLLQQRNAILSSISDAFSALDRDWRYTYANAKVSELAGRPASEIVGHVIWEIFPEAIGTEFYARCHRARETQQAQHFETFYEPWGRWLDTRIYPTGEGIVVFRADVTEQKKQEELLRESERRLHLLEEQSRLAVEAADVGIFDYYPATGELRWSNRCNELFGLPANSEVDYNVYLKGIHPDDRHIIQETVESVARPGSNGRYDIEYRTIGLTDGKERWLSEKGRAVFDSSGKITRFIGAVLDITERKQSEHGIRAREAQLRFVTDHAASVLIAHCDRQERFLFVNAPYAMRFGQSRDDLIGRPLRETIGEGAYAIVAPQIAEALKGKRVDFEAEIPYVTGTRWMASTYVPEVQADGQVLSFVAVIQDITDRKIAELILERAKREAEDANRAKDQFLAMLSHELRTPLTPVLMTIAALRRDPTVNDSLRRDLEVLQRNVELEALLIDDLLDLTRFTHGKFELHQEAVDIHAAIDHALGISSPDLTKKNLSVIRHLEATEHHCWADAARLQQVFWNLVKNAVKFTPHGGKIEVRTRDDGDHFIIIDVADTGIGIDPALQPRIFDAFEQGGRSTTSKFGGLGLGLAIAKRVIDLHHGSITVRSPGRDQGATFTIKLKAMQTSLLDGPAYLLDFDAVAAGPADILLVEDHEDTARVMQRILGAAGYIVAHAPRIADARKLAKDRKFDLIISDVGLPDGTGLELMRELHQTYGLRGIALSGYGTDEDLAASKAAGFSEHLTKPIDWDRLRDAITRLMTTAKAKTEESEPSSTG
jgi:PAS domain S-box-containing protein